MEAQHKDARYVPFVAMPVRALYGAVILLGCFLLASSAIVASVIQTRPLLSVETLEPARALPPCEVQGNMQGPFRPRPQPAPLPDPPEEDLSAAERRLLGRIREWVEARATRAEERAIERLQDDLLGALDADPNMVHSGVFTAVFAAKLAAFIGKVLKLLINAAVIAALVALLVAYWPWIAGAVVAVVAVLRLWIGSIVNARK